MKRMWIRKAVSILVMAAGFLTGAHAAGFNALTNAAERNQKHTVTNGYGKTIGMMLVVKVETSDLKKVTGAQLKEFFKKYVVGSKYQFVTVFATKNGKYTGYGITFVPSIKTGTVGTMNTDEKSNSFGSRSEDKRDYFYYDDSDQIQFVYYDEEVETGLHDLKETDIAFKGLF